MPNLILNREARPASLRLGLRPNSKSRWFDDQGNINASSTRDLIGTIGSLMTASSSGRGVWGNGPEAETAADVQQRKEEREAAVAAYHDHKSTAFQELGTQISAILYQTAKREGFLRRFLLQGDLEQGTIPRIQVRYQNVNALVMTEAGVVAPQLVKQRYIYPPEYYVVANIRVEDRDIAQGAADILEDAYNRGLENINVKEDRVLVSMLDQAVGVTNPLFLLAGGGTPSNIAAMRTAILTYGLQAEQWLISADFWTDIAGNAAAFGNLFDPVTRYELVQTGFLGTLLGMAITTDGFRDPQQRVVQPNDSYVLTSPVNLGAYTDRGPVKAVEQNQYADGIPGRGWFFSSLESTTIANTRGVVKGRRV